MTAAPIYVQVLLPVKLRWIPTYCADTPLQAGRRVCVALGKKRYDGVVWRTLEHPDLAADRIQPILSVQDDLPPVSAEELRFWAFLADYYLCTLGEVYKAAFPLLKLRSEHTAADILARLQQRLEKREQALQGRHSERVMQRLTAECDALRAQIKACQAPSGSAWGETDGKVRRPSSQTSRKPLVLTDSRRRDKYLPALQEVLAEGRQALVLTPEIAFCDQLETLLAPALGPSLFVFHSDKTPARRRAAAEVLRRGESAVILGTRSALFLPYRDLGLVIVDEEQDPAYKQTEPAPRYQGRDAAVKLADIHGARVLLGAAVPSLETLLNVRQGKYALADTDAGIPAAEIIDLSAERRKNGLVGTFSRKLIEAIRMTEGPVVLLRGWEKPEPLQEEIAALFPDRMPAPSSADAPARAIRVLTLNALKREGAGDAALLAVLQADALVSRDDFRADERAAQIVGTLCQFAPRVVVQTAIPARFGTNRGADALLEERRQFGFPPYTRLVEIRRQGTGEVIDRHFLPRDHSLAQRKAALLDTLPAGAYPDVDPLD